MKTTITKSRSILAMTQHKKREHHCKERLKIAEVIQGWRAASQGRRALRAGSTKVLSHVNTN
jgi:hypothetical protein